MPDIKELLTKTFSEIANNFGSFFGNFIASLIILLVGWIAARIIKSVSYKLLQKVGIDKIGEKLSEIDTIKKFNIKVSFSKIFSSVVYIFIMLFVFISAAQTLGIPAISNMFEMVVVFIPKFIAATLMLIAGIFIADIVKKFVVSICASFNIPSGKLIGMGVFAFLLFIAVIASLGQAGINTDLLESSFNILIGGIILAFSIGYGIATKNILLNILSSFYMKKNFQIGQTIEIDGVKGQIENITSTNIILKTSDHLVSFPLKVFQEQKITIHKS